MCTFSRLAFCSVLLPLSRCRRKGRPSCQQDFYYLLLGSLPSPPSVRPLPPQMSFEHHFWRLAIISAPSGLLSAPRRALAQLIPSFPVLPAACLKSCKCVFKRAQMLDCSLRSGPIGSLIARTAAAGASPRLVSSFHTAAFLRHLAADAY